MARTEEDDPGHCLTACAAFIFICLAVSPTVYYYVGRNAHETAAENYSSPAGANHSPHPTPSPSPGVAHVKGNFTALVLSGGGAKGAFELGVIEGICKTNSLKHVRNWSMIVGTSIGALNAAALAQFPPEQQCHEALQAVEHFWNRIQETEDVWVSSNLADPVELAMYGGDAKAARRPCLVYRNFPSLSLAFADMGGFCDPSPGRDAFRVAVSDKKIRESGTSLRVVATSLRTGLGKWWNESSKNILDGALASGALAPVVYPMQVDGETYVDGGFVANTPIVKALEEGAKKVVVVMLDPITESGLISNFSELVQNRTDLGMAIMDAEYKIMARRYFLEHELFESCFMYPDREILAYVPPISPGSLIDFDKKALKRMRSAGYNLTQAADPIDICKKVFPHKDRFSLLAREKLRPLAEERKEVKAQTEREKEEKVHRHRKHLRVVQMQGGTSSDDDDLVGFFEGFDLILIGVVMTFALTGLGTCCHWIFSRCARWAKHRRESALLAGDYAIMPV